MTFSDLQGGPIQPSEIDVAILQLDGWLESMRVHDPVTGLRGYGGPVVHWWWQSLIYTGPGLDWRYEGIIAGYLTLWRRTSDSRWLDKAMRAGDDLVDGQLAGGHFSASAFELNPGTGGTPHEAANDVGLLLLAKELKNYNSKNIKVGANKLDYSHNHSWQDYLETAKRNLQKYYLNKLWDEESRSFRDNPIFDNFVPNKAATACEALFLLSEVLDDDCWVESYVLPNLNRILAYQVQDGGKLDGAIAQGSVKSARVEKYFPLYIARCIPALLRGYQWTNNEKYLNGAIRAMNFISQFASQNDVLPTVIYPNGQHNRYPSWIAPLGDILRVVDQMRQYGLVTDFSVLETRLLAGRDSRGGFKTATGFAGQSGVKHPLLPEVRDLFLVTGWCDKTFRYLSSRFSSCQTEEISLGNFETECVFDGKRMRFEEDHRGIQIYSGNKIIYCWTKGEIWAKSDMPGFWLR